MSASGEWPPASTTAPSRTSIEETSPGPVGRSALRGVGTVLASASISQSGAACGALAFPAIGPVGVVAIRQLVAAAVLVPVARPPLRRLSGPQWTAVLGLAAVFGTMNITLYLAVERIGLGLAVTLEFLGPLAVALLGSRRLLDLICGIGAGAGVYILVLPGSTTDILGVGLALLAAGSWAMYILMNTVAGSRLPGLQATAAATCVTGVLYLPALVWLALQGAFTDPRWLWAVVAGVSVSAVGFGLDLIALRTIPRRLFGVLASAHPVTATLAGLVILREDPSAHQLIGVATIVIVNVIAVSARASKPADDGAQLSTEPDPSARKREVTGLCQDVHK